MSSLIGAPSVAARQVQAARGAAGADAERAFEALKGYLSFATGQVVIDYIYIYIIVEIIYI